MTNDIIVSAHLACYERDGTPRLIEPGRYAFCDETPEGVTIISYPDPDYACGFVEVGIQVKDSHHTRQVIS